MAFVECPNCHHQISPSATACPKCGHPVGQAGPAATVKKKSGCLKWCLIAFVVLAALSLLTFALNPDKRKAEEPAVAEKQVEAPDQAEAMPEPVPSDPVSNAGSEAAPVTARTFDFDRTQFQKKFNAKLREFGQSYQLKDAKSKNSGVIANDKVKTWVGSITQHMGVSVVEDVASGKVTSMIFILQPGQTQEDVLNVVIVVGSIIATLNPELTPEERGRLIEDLNLKSGSTGEATRGEVQYNSEPSKELGSLLFSISPKPAMRTIYLD